MYLIAGIIIGFVAAIPIGPINVYAISQTLKRDFIHGLLVGITSALMDVMFCFAVLTGTRHLIMQLQALALHFKGLGSLLLLLIAVRLIIQASKNGDKKTPDEAITHHKPVITTVLMYITNPSLYAFWIGIGTMVSAHTYIAQRGFDPLLFSLACGVGTMLWYFALVRYVWKRHHKLGDATIKKLLYVTAGILIILAGYLVITLF